MKAFLLTEEPWIPVRLVGEPKELSLKETLFRAHEIERLEDPSPLVEAALFRLLLAVLHRALQGPEDKWELFDLYNKGRLPEEAIQNYLNTYRERFWLFHPETPFYQVADLPTDDPMPWTKLRPEIASGNNPTLFSHAYDDNPTPASYAEAARHLVAHQTFVPGGLIQRLGVTSDVDAPLARAAAFIPQGKSLFESLIYSLVPYTPEGDEPIWEMPSVKTDELENDANKRRKKKLPFVGRTRIYTWLSRAVRLIPENGEVRFIGYGPGIVPLNPELYHGDPHVAYRENKGRLLPVRLREDRGFWRDFTTLYPPKGSGISPSAVGNAISLHDLRNEHRSKSKGPAPLAVIGLVYSASNKGKVLEIRREHYPLPTHQSSGIVQLAIKLALEKTEKISKCLKKAGRTIIECLLTPDANLSNPHHSKKITKHCQTDKKRVNAKEVEKLLVSLPLTSLYYQILGAEFPRFLIKLNLNHVAAETFWSQAIEQAWKSAWRETRAAVGTEARALKALQEGEHALYSCIQKEVER